MRWIAHMDLDAFYAACEQRDNPAYRGRPVVIGALPGHRGVVATASYEARRFGIRSAMPVSEAWRRCPDAVYLRPDMRKYRAVSRQVFQVLDGISPCVEAASIDEAYLDISGLGKLIGPPQAIGREIKQRIRDATGLGASVGIGPNRLIAKLGSDYHKPDGMTVIPPERVLDFLGPMPVSNLRGLGRQTLKVFKRLGLATVAQLRQYPLPVLETHLGKKAAYSFHQQALGIASDEITTGRRRKSISRETTFEHDLEDSRILHGVLLELCADVARTARREDLCGQVVTLKVRFSGFDTYTRQFRRHLPTRDERDVLRDAWQLFKHGDLPQKPVRLIGAGLSDWSDDENPQADLFNSTATGNRQQLLETMDAVAEKFGKGKLQLGIPRRKPGG